MNTSWADWITAVQEALRLQPQAVEQGCLLAQLYMMRGQLEDALEIAAALREAAPQVKLSRYTFLLCIPGGPAL